MSSHSFISCTYCGKSFTENRNCTVHMNYCREEMENRRKKPKLFKNVLLNSMGIKGVASDVRKDEEYKKTTNIFDVSCYENEKMINRIDEGSIMNEGDYINGSYITTEQSIENLADQDNNYSTKQLALIQQEKDYQTRMRNAHQLWSIDDIGKLELLNILSKHNCTNGVYKDVMGWARFYSKQKDSNLFKSKRIESRSVVLREIQKRRNMELMKPIIKHVALGSDLENKDQSNELLEEKSSEVGNSNENRNKNEIYNEDISASSARKKQSNISIRNAEDSCKKKSEVIQSNTINVTTFDFKQQLLSMLRDDELMDPGNLVLEDPCGSEHDKRMISNEISEIQDSEWYRCAENYYEKKLGLNPYRVVCGIILTVDKTHTDAKGKLCLEPVQFSLSIFNTETRKKNQSAWKCLGFVNDLDAYVNAQFHIEDYKTNVKSVNNVININDTSEEMKITESDKSNKKKRRTTRMKSINYHKILSSILDSLKDCQKEGLVWDLKFPSNKIHRVHLVFPLCFCVVDMKGARQLCGMYDTGNVQRPCISCLCPRPKLHDSNTVCKPVLEKDMMKIIAEDNNQSLLQSVSQHDNPHNAFFELETCDWPYGIWGLCPSEVLHQFYEGVIMYALEEFMQVFLTKKYRENLEKWIHQMLHCIKNQSNRDMYPTGVFTLGVTRMKSMKGIEKFACVFYLAMFLNMQIALTEYFDGRKSMKEDMKKRLLEWKKLFETCCYYHDWVSGQIFYRNQFVHKQKRIIQFHKLFQKLIQRGGDGIQNIPKFHEFFHVIRNIERHGPPSGYSTLTTEGTHIDVKEAAKHTARHVDTFSIQTGQRMYEKNSIKDGFKFVRSFAKSTYIGDCKKFNKKELDNAETFLNKNVQKSYGISDKSDISEREKRQGLFFATWNVESRKLLFLKNVKQKSFEIRNTDFTTMSLMKFFEDSIFNLMESVSEEIVIPCYTSINRRGYSFRGMSRDESNYSGWAIFQWSDKNNKTFGVPGKIVTFVDMSKCVFKNEWQGHFAQNDLHVIIQSMIKLPTEKRSQTINRHASICVSSSLSTDGKGSPEYYCVSVNTILNTAYVIPDFGNKDIHKYLYVYPRISDERVEGDVKNDKKNLDGWSNKF